MPVITLRAHFDGKQILLDEPYELRADTPLLVTVIQPADADRLEWLDLSLQGLAGAYGDSEPDYSAGHLVE